MRAVAVRGDRKPLGAADRRGRRSSSTSSRSPVITSGGSEARASLEACRQRRSGVCQHTGGATRRTAARPRPRPMRRSPRLAETDALASDVLVQFWWRAARARILARRATSSRPRRWAGCGGDRLSHRALSHRARAHFALAEVLALAARQAPARAEAALRGSSCARRRHGPARQHWALARRTQEELRVELLLSHGCSIPPLPPPPPGIRFRMAHLLSCAHGRRSPKRLGHGPLTGR